jgi:hypothetical protein
MAETRIRPARPEEAAALTALAVRSKGHWPYDETMMAVFRRTIVITAEDIAAHCVLVHETAGVADGVAVLIAHGEEAERPSVWAWESGCSRRSRSRRSGPGRSASC